MVAALLAEYDHVLAKSTNTERNDILQRVRKKGLVQDRESIEMWYAVPNAESPGNDSPGLDDAVHEPLRMAPRTRRGANWRESRRADVRVRVLRVLQPLQGVLVARGNEPAGIGLGPLIFRTRRPE